MIKTTMAALVVALWLPVGLAQAPPASTPAATPPALTELQRLQLQTLSQQIELAQLRAQKAQTDFEAARKAVGELVQSLQVAGYTLDLQTLTYVKQPVPKVEAPPKK